MNRRLLVALIACCENRMQYNTSRHTETLACGFIRANLQAALGLDVDAPDLVMSEARIERELDPDKERRDITARLRAQIAGERTQ